MTLISIFFLPQIVDVLQKGKNNIVSSGQRSTSIMDTIKNAPSGQIPSLYPYI